MSSQHTQSPTEIETEIERTRSHLDDTIDAIQAKFSTGQLVDQALGYLRRTRHGPAEFASNLGNTAKRNPMPVTLTGLGIGWLMFSSNRPPARTALPVKPSSESGDGSGIRDTMGSAASRAKHMAGSSRERAGRVAHGTQEQIGRISHGTRSSISSVSHGTGRAGRQTVDFMREQPLVVGAVGIAFGAALGAMLAPSRFEDDMMGEASDDTREAAAETAERQFDKAESAVLSDSESTRNGFETDERENTGHTSDAAQESAASSEDPTERDGTRPSGPARAGYRL